MKRAKKITVTTTGTPPLEGAEAFARWMAEALNKKPDLKLVKPDGDYEESRSPQTCEKRG